MLPANYAEDTLDSDVLNSPSSCSSIRYPCLLCDRDGRVVTVPIDGRVLVFLGNGDSGYRRSSRGLEDNRIGNRIPDKSAADYRTW